MDGWLGRRFPIAALAWQNLTRQRMRSILAMAGITIGVVAIASLGMFGATFQASLLESFEDTGSSVMVFPGSDLEEDTFDSDHVAAVERHAPSEVQTVRSESANITIGGETQERQLVSVGDPHDVTAAEDGYIPSPWRSGALVGNTLAEALDLTAGDSITIEGQTVRVMAVLEPDAQAQLVQTETSILVPERQLDSDGFSQIIVRTDSPQEAFDLARDLRENLNSDRDELYNVVDFENAIEQFNNQMSLIQNFLLGIGAISLIVAAVSILNVMLMSTIERKGEIGVLRAVGYQKRDILRLMLTEALLLGIVGAIVGLIVSVLMGMLINSLLLGDAFAFQPSAVVYVLLGFLFGTGASLLSGAYPAWKAANERPVDALRD